MRRLLLLTFLFTLTLTTACKIEVTVPKGGEVITESGAIRCSSGETCVVDVSDLFFKEKFRAVPEEGFDFLAWHKSNRYLCGGSKGVCEIDSSGAESNPVLVSVLRSDETFHLKPLFTKDRVDALPLWNPIDRHSEGYAYSSIYEITGVDDPHSLPKACRIDEYSFGQEEFIAVGEITWWGYYASGDLAEDAGQLHFDIKFYAAESLAGDDVKIISRRRFSVEADSSWDIAPVTVQSRLDPDRYEGRLIYRYTKTFDRPVFVPRGNVLFSIEQLDPVTRKPDRGFILHVKGGGRYGHPMYIRTQDQGWVSIGSSCFVRANGYHSIFEDIY